MDTGTRDRIAGGASCRRICERVRGAGTRGGRVGRNVVEVRCSIYGEERSRYVAGVRVNLLVRVIELSGRCNGAKIRFARRSHCMRARVYKVWNENSGQNSDDGHNDHQLDQSKAAFRIESPAFCTVGLHVDGSARAGFV